MTNPDPLPGFVRITALHDEFNTSRKSVERRRDRARETGDAKVYKAFRLRTKDGEVFAEPSLEQVKNLRTAGRVPEWYVSRAWLTKEFGERVGETTGQGTRQSAGQPASVSDSVAVALQSQIVELRTDKQRLIDQLDKERQERTRINELHDRDKERLSERSREDRQLMGQLHQLMAKMEERLAVPAQTQPIDGKVIEQGTAREDQDEAPENPAVPSPTPQDSPVAKPRRWRRWLGL